MRVRALLRPSKSLTRAKFYNKNSDLVEFRFGDLAISESLDMATQGCSAVVHCAALVGERGKEEDYFRVNVTGTRRLYNSALAAGCQRFVHVSTLGVYDLRDHFGTTETAALSVKGIDAYTRSKIAAEAFLLAESSKRHQTTKTAPLLVILRPGFTYGINDRNVLPRLTQNLRRGIFVYSGSGEQKLNNTGAQNFAQAVLLALTKDIRSDEVFNITDGRLVTRREMMDTLAKLLDLQAPRYAVPRFVLSLLTHFGLPMAYYKFLTFNLEYSIEKARRLLGYDPVIDFQEGMRAALGDFPDFELDFGKESTL
jgi:nucleoside-diphosphate-sugar epimerase